MHVHARLAQEVSSQFARQILVASHPVLSRGVVSYEDVRGVLRAELDGVADAIESIGTVAEAYVGFTCDMCALATRTPRAILISPLHNMCDICLCLCAAAAAARSMVPGCQGGTFISLCISSWGV